MKKKYFWGIVLIIIGGLGILDKVFQIRINVEIWPLCILCLGLWFEYSYFSTKSNPGILVPGGILTTIGLLFIFETITRWRFAASTWPVYQLAVAVGLFQMYWCEGRYRKGLLIPICILGGISLVSIITIIFGNIFTWLNSSVVVFAGMLIAGIYLILKKDNNNNQ